ncbi:hypothetical protein [Pseudomonas laurylsulfatiphila]|uniref:hypothetical protein n=1 Tax=Pseudomonas laurylsulfatiphila TaxID=2011015 RepID=UPI00142DE23E|nr:hypothetical protein [Pseudomonas laurylsulfatiphila]
MIIDIKAKPASHCWVVCMDALKVNFNTLGEAQAFVGQLTARIEAPHVWPSGASLAGAAPLRRLRDPGPGVADPGVMGGYGAVLMDIACATDKNQVVGTRSNQSVGLLPD